MPKLICSKVAAQAWVTNTIEYALILLLHSI